MGRHFGWLGIGICIAVFWAVLVITVINYGFVAGLLEVIGECACAAATIILDMKDAADED